MTFNRTLLRKVFLLVSPLALATLPAAARAQSPAAPPQAVAPGSPMVAAPTAAPQSLCGNQPLCYEAPDFVATVTDFRTSTQGYYKIIDTTIRFQNKTNSLLTLGYANGSGNALDERGNRYGVGGGNALRGIGIVNGNSFDPKFAISPGGYGDASFELVWAPGQQVYGFTFDLNLTVDEINSFQGNQHTLGGEYPLHFQGLANGTRGAAPGMATNAATPAGSANGLLSSGAGGSAPVCGAAGTATALAGATNSTAAQNASATASSTVSSAAAAISNLGSIFGKKKAAATPAAATNTPSAAPCVPAPASQGAVATTAGVAPAAATNGATAVTPTTATPGAAVTPTAAKTVAATNAAAVKAGTPPAAAAAKPVAVAPATPAAPVKTAVKATTPPPPAKKPAPAPAKTPDPQKPQQQQ